VLLTEMYLLARQASRPQVKDFWMRKYESSVTLKMPTSKSVRVFCLGPIWRFQWPNSRFQSPVSGQKGRQLRDLIRTNSLWLARWGEKRARVTSGKCQHSDLVHLFPCTRR